LTLRGIINDTFSDAVDIFSEDFNAFSDDFDTLAHRLNKISDDDDTFSGDE